jgi:hypothetical protein
MMTEKSTGYNTGFASGGLTCKLGALCFYSSSVLIDSFVLRNPPERKALKRCEAILPCGVKVFTLRSQSFHSFASQRKLLTIISKNVARQKTASNTFLTKFWFSSALLPFLL